MGGYRPPTRLMIVNRNSPCRAWALAGVCLRAASVALSDSSVLALSSFLGCEPCIEQEPSNPDDEEGCEGKQPLATGF